MVVYELHLVETVIERNVILQLVNYYLEPFSNALWKNEIQSYASRKDEFNWQKETIFGGVYQCVIATRKK